LWGGLPSFL
jgi:hypothetical protein